MNPVYLAADTETTSQLTSLYEWYKCVCTLFLGLLGCSLYLYYVKLIQPLQKEVHKLQEEQEILIEQLDSYEKDEGMKYGMLRSLLFSLQQDIQYHQKRLDIQHKQLESYQEEQKETLQHILDVYQSIKKWIDNEKQRHKVWYDEETDTYVLSTEVEHNVYIHDAFSFHHGESNTSGYFGRFASTKKYETSQNSNSLVLATPLDKRIVGHPYMSPFLMEWTQT